MSKNKRKMALIGLGNWGKKLLPKINEFGFCDVFTTGDAKNIDWLRKNGFKNNIFSSLDRLLVKNDYSDIFIATPIDSHQQIIELLLKNNDRIWIEKPVVASTSNLDNLIKFARENKKIIFCNHIFTNDPLILKIKKLLSNANLSSVNFNWNKIGSFKENIVWNLAYHEVSIAYFLFGKPLDSKISNFKKDNTNELSFSLLYPNFTIECNIDRNSSAIKKEIVCLFDNGTLIWNPKSLEFCFDGICQTNSSNEDNITRQLEKFFALTFDSIDFKNHLEEVRNVTKITEEIFVQTENQVNSL